MQYEFPIYFSNRTLVPAIDKVLSSVEKTFEDIAGEPIKLSYGETQVLTFSVTSEKVLDDNGIAMIKREVMAILKDHFKEYHLTMGDPIIKDADASLTV